MAKEFMLYIRNAGDAKAALSADEHLRFIKQCEVYIGQLKSSNQLVAAQPIVREGFVVSKSNEEWTKQPIDPTKEVQVGYYHIVADNIEEAIEIAKQNPEFGELNDFKSLVAQAHELDMKLIVDWVANHTGYDHHWTKEHPDWYEHDAEGNFVERHGWVDVIDLNYKNKDLRAAMIADMQYWIKECDIDGFRCDMAHLVPLDFWVEAKQHCETLKELFWLAECEVPEYHKVFDASYAWKWMHATENLIRGFTGLHDVKNVLKEYQDYPAGALKLFFTSNHDENSWNGTEYEKYGNAAKALSVFTFTWPGIPLIYSGQELPNMKRLKFFDKDFIEWNSYPLQMESFYKNLLALKSNNAALHQTGNINVLPTEFNDSIFSFLRTTDNNKVLVILNLSDKDRLQFKISHPLLEGNFTHLFSGITYQLGAVQGFEMQAWEYIVLIQ